MSIDIARLIDHTNLKPDATFEQMRKLCDEALEHGFASVCVNPAWVDYCNGRLLGQTDVKVCTVVGFPLGATLPEVKAHEAKIAIQKGATEVDMVINVGALKSGYVTHVEWDIHVVRSAIPKTTLKVIIEACLLTREEKIMACRLAQRTGADFVKTSTGFSIGGATVEDVRLMREIVGPEMGIKASAGIRDFETAKAMIEAGATRLGCSASVAIVLESKK